MRKYRRVLICTIVVLLALSMVWVSTALAVRGEISVRLKETKNKEVVAIATGILKDADLTKSYTATISLFENDVPVPLATRIGSVDPANPEFEDAIYNDLFRIQFIPHKTNPDVGTVKVVYKRYHLSADMEYTAEVEIKQDSTTLLRAVGTAQLPI
jgi:hypothetical protein